jgi:hypothetical protein
VRARLTKLAGISALCVAVGAAIPTVAVAVPPPVALACGSTVTGPVALSQDLVCSGDAITLLSGTLDLRHHTISGDGTGTAVSVGTAAGGTATVENGTITGFATGIQAALAGGLHRLIVQSVSVTDSTDGILGLSIDDVVLDDVTLTDVSDIAVSADTTLVTVNHATITHSGQAFFVIDDGGVTATNINVSDNSAAGVCSQGFFNINDAQFNRNADGISLYQCEGSVFSNSVFLNNTNAGITEGQGFDSYANPTLTVTGDHFQGNGIGLHLSDAAMSALVTGSVFILNGSGIVMDQCAPEDAPCLPIADQFSSNRFAQNHGNGVTWGYGTVTMTSNRFQSNTGWGFFANDGTTVVDGGGNKAQSNDVGSCSVGLVCS